MATNTSDIFLDPTTYYYRVNFVILLAGPRYSGRCGFNQTVAEHFLSLSASNTLTQRRLWKITEISDGPAVFNFEDDVVTVGAASVASVPQPAVTATPSTTPEPAVRAGELGAAAGDGRVLHRWAPLPSRAPLRLAQRQADGLPTPTPTASPTPNAAGVPRPTSTEAAMLMPDASMVSPNSVRVRVTMYADAVRRDLMMTTYFEYVEQGFLAQGMTSAGFPTEVAYFEQTPKVIDAQELTEADRAKGLSAGAITGIVVAGVGLVAMGAFVLLEAGALSTAGAADAAAAAV